MVLRLLPPNKMDPRTRNRYIRIVAGFVCVLVTLGLAGCGASSGSSASNSKPATLALSISPSTASVTTGGTQQFSASVTGTSNTGVNWLASGGGTISSTGVYTAGTNPGTYTVTATSLADGSTSAQAKVTVTATPPPGTASSITKDGIT